MSPGNFFLVSYPAPLLDPNEQLPHELNLVSYLRKNITNYLFVFIQCNITLNFYQLASQVILSGPSQLVSDPNDALIKSELLSISQVILSGPSLLVIRMRNSLKVNFYQQLASYSSCSQVLITVVSNSASLLWGSGALLRREFLCWKIIIEALFSKQLASYSLCICSK